jgi:hypothetical protein
MLSTLKRGDVIKLYNDTVIYRFIKIQSDGSLLLAGSDNE